MPLFSFRCLCFPKCQKVIYAGQVIPFCMSLTCFLNVTYFSLLTSTCLLVVSLFIAGQHPCHKLKCTPPTDCLVDRFGIASCVCPPPCPQVMVPVCGSDGNHFVLFSFSPFTSPMEESGHFSNEEVITGSKVCASVAKSFIILSESLLHLIPLDFFDFYGFFSPTISSFRLKLLFLDSIFTTL